MFIINEQKIDKNKLELISNEGTECIVFKYNNNAIKLFRKN